MSIALDASLGFERPVGVLGSRTLTTTSAAAAGSRVIVPVVCWDDDGSGPSNPIPTLTIGGVGATMDFGPVVNPSQRGWIFSLEVPSGLASGSAISLSLTHTVQALSINATSWLGIQSAAGYVETSGSGTGTDTTHWLTPTITVASAEALLLAFATSDGHAVSTTSTPNTTSPATVELYDYWASDTQTNTSAYRIVSPGSYSIGGTWSQPDAQRLTGIVAYKTAAVEILIPSYVSAPMVGRSY